MHRSLAQAQGQNRLLGSRAKDGLLGRGEIRGSDVDAFLEEGTVQRVRFVKEGQNCELALPQQTLERHLSAGNEALDEDLRLGLGSLLPQKRLDASKGNDELVGVVGSNHPTTGRQGDGLENRGVVYSASAR